MFDDEDFWDDEVYYYEEQEILDPDLEELGAEPGEFDLENEELESWLEYCEYLNKD
jgi:hypothetical protein